MNDCPRVENTITISSQKVYFTYIRGRISSEAPLRPKANKAI